jgi:DNA-binding GntR family transcriptional regulator
MLTRLEPIETTTLHVRAYQQMRKALMSGMFKPGEAVTLRGVSEALGTSVMPVREAVRRLVAERALEMPTSRSLRVPLMSRARFDELTDLRVLLEGMAAGLAAQNATGTEIDELNTIDKQQARHVRSRDFRAMLGANEEFHFAVYAASRNELLISMIETLWLQGGPYLSLLLDDPAVRQHYTDHSHHQDVIDALRRRDRRAARDGMSKDISEAAKLFKAHIGKWLMAT